MTRRSWESFPSHVIIQALSLCFFCSKRVRAKKHGPTNIYHAKKRILKYASVGPKFKFAPEEWMSAWLLPEQSWSTFCGELLCHFLCFFLFFTGDNSTCDTKASFFFVAGKPPESQWSCVTSCYLVTFSSLITDSNFGGTPVECGSSSVCFCFVFFNRFQPALRLNNALANLQIVMFTLFDN